MKIPGRPGDRKLRPALVVSLDIRNRLANDVIVIPLSTTMRPTPTHVPIAQGEGGVHLPSMAKCEQVTTLDKSLLVRGPFAGRVTEVTMVAVERGIMRAIGVVI